MAAMAVQRGHRTSDRMRAVANTLSCLGFLAGFAWFLTRLAGWPLPDHWPTATELLALADHPLSGPFLRNLGACLGWLFLAMLTFAIVVETLARLTRHRLRLRLPAPLRVFAAGVVGASIIGLITAPAHAKTTSAGPPQKLPAAAALATPSPALTHVTTTTAGKVTFVIRDQRYHVLVRRGDTMSKIARQWLGDANRWPEICKLNNHRHFPAVGGTLHDCDLIYPRWDLKLPADATPPPAAVAQTPRKPPAGSTPAETTTPPPGASPQSSSSSTPAPAATSQSPGTIDDQTSHRPDDTGIDLPGGWLTTALAAALAAAAARMWLHRRHRYKPGPITATTSDGPTHAEPLTALAQIQRAARRTDQPDPSDPEPTDPAGNPHPNRRQTPKPATRTTPDLAGIGDLPLAAGLGLTGPAADAAARALVVAQLAEPHTTEVDSPRVILPELTAHQLGITASPPHPQMIIVASTADAMTHLEEQIIHRTRITTDLADTSTVPGADDPPLPRLLLITDLPEPAQQTRLATGLALGAKVNIGSIILGDWPHGPVLRVNADGTTDTDGSRLSVMDIPTTLETLSMLHESSAHRPALRHTVASTTPASEPAAHHHDPPPATEAPPDVGPPPAQPAHPDNTTPEAITPAKVRLRVFGVPAVLAPDGRPMPGLRESGRELLTYLAVNPGPQDIRRIRATLFPHADRKRGEERLLTNASVLRKCVRQSIALASPGTNTTKINALVNTRGKYHLDPDLVTIDLWTAKHAYQAAIAATDQQSRRAHLLAAADAITGPLAGDDDFPWIDIDRESVRQFQITVLAQAAEATSDDPHTSRAMLDKACTIDPLSEELARRAMHAAATVGDADAIRRQLRTLRSALADVGIDIDSDTEQLAQKLLDDLNHHLPAPQPRSPEPFAGASQDRTGPDDHAAANPDRHDGGHCPATGPLTALPYVRRSIRPAAETADHHDA
jgi:DNA-binding SARP family transcriptional activator